MTTLITNRMIVEANKKALAERRLGAFNHQSPPGKRFGEGEAGKCLYRYADGSGCAIGVTLPEDVITKVLKSPFLNQTGFGKLAINGLVEYECPLIAGITQQLHDGWVRGQGFSYEKAIELAERVSADTKAFIWELATTLPEMNEAGFRAWIDFLDKKYPA